MWGLFPSWRMLPMIGHGYGPGGTSGDLNGEDKILKCLRRRKRRGRRSIGIKTRLPSVPLV